MKHKQLSLITMLRHSWNLSRAQKLVSSSIYSLVGYGLKSLFKQPMSLNDLHALNQMPFTRPQNADDTAPNSWGFTLFFPTHRSFQHLKACGADHKKSRKKSPRQYLTTFSCEHPAAPGWPACCGPQEGWCPAAPSIRLCVHSGFAAVAQRPNGMETSTLSNLSQHSTTISRR